MKFDMVTIKNFRNFENISVALTNKNVLFGMNDVGKTNFLYALRFVFDKDIRRQNFNDTDYYKKHTGSPIEIIVTIDISDQDDSDSQKLRAKLKGALLSGQNKVYIKVAASYDEKEEAVTVEIYGTKTDENTVEITTEPSGPNSCKTYRSVYDKDGNLLRSEEVGYSQYKE